MSHAFLSIAMVPLVASLAPAQTVLQPLRPTQLAPVMGGSWEGPYSPPVVSTGEITHAIYLPPHDGGGAPAGEVFFIANQYRNCGVPFDPTEKTHVWQWDPANPNAITRMLDVPNTQHESLWCSAHAIAPNGDVWAVAGTDLTLPCYYGSLGVYQWTPSGGWQARGSLDPLAPRWYPTALQIGSPIGDQLLVLGHEQDPQGPEETHQVLDLTTGALSPLFINVVGDPTCQPTAARARFMGYPWTHWLASGVPFVTGPLDSEQYFGCPAAGGSFRWIRGPTNARMREAGNSIHFLDWTAGGRHEQIYLIGGLSSFLGPGAASGKADWYVLDTMESIEGPDPQGSAAWHNEPTLFTNRRHAVSVQTPDGNFYVIGGIGWNGPSNPSGSMVARTTPELFDRRKGKWSPMNAHQRARSYHSVAFLLRDGRIVSAGGILDPIHTVEIFSPPYLFRGPRPTVSAVPSTFGYCSSTPCGTFTFTLDLGAASDPIESVSLLRPASVTHGFDMNQRWVELPIDAQSQPDPVGMPLRWDLSVRLPEDWNVAPPGWYMLFAVTLRGIPSVGEYVRIQ